MIRRPRHIVVFAAMLVAGCLGSPTSGGGNAPIVGTWDYAGLQTSPTTATLSGTLKIDNQQDGIFSGTLSVIETPNSGPQVQRSGVVSGQSLSNTGVQFDVVLNNGTDSISRTHLGTITGDSLVGAWAEQVVGLPSGSFRAHRVSIP